MKTGNGFVRPYYEMLHPANKDDLDEVSHDIAGILESLPATGHVWADMLEGDDQNIERAIAWACSHGIMQKTTMGGHTIELESVRFWIGQLNHSKMKNVGNGRGTRRAYAEQLEAFDGWLSGTKFPAERGSNRDGKTGRSFSDVEELLRFCEDSDHGAQAARRAVRQYLAELAESGYSLSTAVLKCAAIKSYFAAHDMQVDVRVDRKRHASHDVRDDSEMNLLDFYKMMISGGMDAMTRAIMMVKFQAGLDSSTMADRFNFEGYPQIVRHFGMEDYAAWDLDRCPVPIKLVRVKTGMQYTTFIDRDAVVHLQDYLRWKEDRYGKHDGTEPLFVTRRGTPVSPNWISIKFSKAAANAGIQKKITPHMYKVRSHEVRDLLKSTLIASGCAPYAADHVLGHAPRDSYEKQAVLYPETLRSEYAKASGRLNVFTSFERYLDSAAFQRAEDKAGPGQPRPDDRYKSLEMQQQEMRAELRKVTENMADMFKIIRASRGVDMPDDVARRLDDL